MTGDPIDDLIKAAAERSVCIDRPYASAYVAARQTLNANANDAEAQRTVKHFELLLSPFGRFTLPYEDWLRFCAEEVGSLRFSATSTASGCAKNPYGAEQAGRPRRRPKMNKKRSHPFAL